MAAGETRVSCEASYNDGQESQTGYRRHEHRHSQEAMVSTQEVVKDQGNLLEVSHFAGTQIHRALAHEKGTGLGAAVAMLEAMIVVVAGYLAYSGRGFLGELLGVSPVEVNAAPPSARLFVFLLTYACLTVICNA